MMTRQTRTAADSHERGSAIIGVLLLLMLMSALAAAMGVSGRTESLITRNHQSRAQARAAAEAGINHAVQITVDYLQTIDPVNIPGALDALLVDTTPLAGGVAFGAPTGIAGALDSTVSYQILLMDEDDPDRGAAQTNLTDDLDPTNNEDGVETTDNNNTLVFRATGIAQGGAAVTLEALIAPVELGAIITDGDLEIAGTVSVTGGDDADVHSNGDLTVNGGSASVSGSLTASGVYDGPAGGYGGAAEKPLPEVSAEDYKHHADFVLEDDGTMTCNGAGGCSNPTTGGTWGFGATICVAANDGNGCRTDWGWRFAGGGWEMGSGGGAPGTPQNGTFYAETDVSISSGPTLTMTLIAEGSIDISGSPNLTAHTNELLFVTDGDLDISGGVETDVIAQGQILVHEQLSISGNATLGGQIIVEDAANTHSLVTTSSITGSVVIDYNGTLGTNLFFVTGWREVR
jgi:hypothetical protein